MINRRNKQYKGLRKWTMVIMVGRRKSAVANLKLSPGVGQIHVNDRILENMFVNYMERRIWIQKPVQISGLQIFDVEIYVKGGGLFGQSQAMQLALTRALVTSKPFVKNLVRKHYLLTCDSRKKERRKYGIKKARKAPQFSKR